jgi:hypothetical protein
VRPEPGIHPNLQFISGPADVTNVVHFFTISDLGQTVRRKVACPEGVGDYSAGHDRRAFDGA